MEALRDAKEAGLIGHIGLAAHLAAVFEAALEVPEIETVMFPYNPVERQGEALIRRAREKDIGFVCMKPLAGGAIENAALAIRWILQNENVGVIIPGMATPEEVRANTACPAAPLTAEEEAELARIREALGTRFCRRCGYCAPCTVGINIPGAFLFYGYLSRYGLAAWARSRYEAMPVTASACVGCGACESRCPYDLPIREMLRECAAAFGK
jgi:predicted aldo/keto reductase-like oxidoreductase